jgi:glycine/D-amino acid oxidase-like deaminating enzyme
MGYSSMYTVNQDDLHPVVGETSIKGLWACNGFSGHGFKLAPAIGSMVAQQVTLYPKPQTPNPKSYTLYPTPLGLL